MTISAAALLHPSGFMLASKRLFSSRLDVKDHPRMPRTVFFPDSETVIGDAFYLRMKGMAREVQLFPFESTVYLLVSEPVDGAAFGNEAFDIELSQELT